LKFNIFTYGDSKLLSTWSNFPYYFSQTIEKRGNEINRINLKPNTFFRFIYKLLFAYWINLIFKLVNSNKYFSFDRSLINYYFARIKIYYYCKRSIDYNIFLTFSYSSYRLSKIPYILFCDQTYLESISSSNKVIVNNSDFLIKKEKENIINAKYILSTNQHNTDFIRTSYDIKRIYLIRGVLNLGEVSRPEIEILNNKMSSNLLIFVGQSYRGRGCDILIEAFNNINERYNNYYKLIIVGLSKKEIDTKNNNIEIYEYLDKGKPEELRKYIAILEEAKLFVMPMRTGPLPGVFYEANYYYTPVITTNIWNVEQIIKNGFNGILVEKPNADLFTEKIIELIEDKEKYLKMAKDSHQYVSNNFSWEKTINEFLKELDK
jgi:glycosyltransferase involved in cell wall biosynthesis